MWTSLKTALARLAFSFIVVGLLNGCQSDKSTTDQLKNGTTSIATESIPQKKGSKCRYTILFSEPDCFDKCYDVLVDSKTETDNIYYIIRDIQKSKNKVHLRISFWDSKRKFREFMNDKSAKMHASFSTEPDQDALIAAGQRNCNVDCLSSKDFSYILVCPNGTTESGRLNEVY